jgi:hypothetical protein
VQGLGALLNLVVMTRALLDLAASIVYRSKMHSSNNRFKKESMYKSIMPMILGRENLTREKDGILMLTIPQLLSMLEKNFSHLQRRQEIGQGNRV